MTPHIPAESRQLGTRIIVLLCALVALYALTFPLQDYDTFWHLAYGRAMVEQLRFINHEIFSYTAAGTFLGSHSQLAQVLLYLAWLGGGANGLLLFKLLIALLVFWGLMRTARLFGARDTLAAVLAMVVLTAGMSRFVERPELFTILMQTLLAWMLFAGMRGAVPTRIFWALPVVMVLWDYLHGALYGLILLTAFVAAETCKGLLFPRYVRLRNWAAETPPERLRQLWIWSGITLLAMCAHPNGLLNYQGFWRVSSHAGNFAMYGEFQRTALVAQSFWYWVCLFATLALLLAFIRRLDFTAIVILIPFTYLSLTYNRATLAFCIAAVPLVAQALVLLGTTLFAKRPRAGRTLASTIPLLLIFAVLLYKQNFAIDTFKFGTGLNENVFPVGSARFVKAVGLSGNMYNMDGFGGYLAFFLAPERKIFHYNQPEVFTALTDFVHKPETRSQWHIRYAIIGKPEELGMMQKEGLVPVYWEPTAMVLVRPDADLQTVAERYRLKYFQPLLADEELRRQAAKPWAVEHLLTEMATYLQYRHDDRIAALFTEFVRKTAATLPATTRTALITAALQENGGHAGLRSLQTPP